MDDSGFVSFRLCKRILVNESLRQFGDRIVIISSENCLYNNIGEGQFGLEKHKALYKYIFNAEHSNLEKKYQFVCEKNY